MKLLHFFRAAFVIVLMSQFCFLVSQVPSGSVAQTDEKAPLGSAEHPVRVSSGVLAGQAIRRDMPAYPIPRCGPGGDVTVLHAIVNPEGKI